MKTINNFIDEKLKVNRNSQIIDDSRNDKEKFASDWQWFNMLITNVKLEEDQYCQMFANLTEPELKVWIKEVQACYAGTDQEKDAMDIKDYWDLGYFYYKNPVTE